MKNERFGYLVDPKSFLHIRVNEGGSIDKIPCFNDDIVVTVNEIMKDGKCRLAVSAPSIIDVVPLAPPACVSLARDNVLPLHRPLGCSVIIRTQSGISPMDAIRDLRRNGIKIYNVTRSLASLADKTGSDLEFVACPTIWKIIRLELTFLRRA